MKQEDDNYHKIFHYLSTRPAATAQEIAQDTDIDVKEIYRYVRENRLRLVKGDTGHFLRELRYSHCPGQGVRKMPPKALGRHQT